MNYTTNFKTRTVKLLSLVSIVFLFLFITILCANAQPVTYGKISSINNDGSISLNTGFDVGFEIGDILVIQRNGIKIGLAHVDQVNPDSSIAMVIKLQPGMDAKSGDTVAYQLLDSGDAIDSEGAFGSQSPPDIIKHKWINQQAAATDYDLIINNQQVILSKNTHHRTAMLRLADAYFKKGWYKHSIQWNQRAIDEKPKSDDNDKILFQIIRAYGYLNEPEKQKLYINFLAKNYPDSVFIGIKMKEALQRQESLQPEWKKYTDPIVDSMGFRKGGMNFIRKDSQHAETSQSPVMVPIENLLLHGKPGLMEPVSNEPVR